VTDCEKNLLGWVIILLQKDNKRFKRRVLEESKRLCGVKRVRWSSKEKNLIKACFERHTKKIEEKQEFSRSYKSGFYFIEKVFCLTKILNFERLKGKTSHAAIIFCNDPEILWVKNISNGWKIWFQNFNYPKFVFILHLRKKYIKFDVS
jgi:hypothetical protein